MNTSPKPGSLAAERDTAITLQCSPEDFGDFISSLLGKPQEITRLVRGHFELKKEDVLNFDHLLIQRIAQQNQGHLIQFTARIIFDDNSTVLLNCIDDFTRYHEVQPKSSTGIHLSWSFLVTFPDRKNPEKQSIDVSILTEGGPSILDDDGPTALVVGMKRFITGSCIGYRIAHTARTWGADVEALLNGHVNSLMRDLPPIRRLIANNSGMVGFVAAGLFFLSCICGAFITTNSVLNEKMQAASALAERDQKLIETTAAKVDFLIEVLATGMWPRYFFYVACFLATAFVVSIFLGIWTEEKSNIREPSFLLLTRKSEERAAVIKGKKRNAWLKFIFTVVWNVVLGIVGNGLFAYYFQGWHPYEKVVKLQKHSGSEEVRFDASQPTIPK